MRSEGRLAAVTAMKCIVDGAALPRDLPGWAWDIPATGGGMGPLGVCGEATGRL